MQLTITAAALILPLLAAGCISRRAYEENVAMLMQRNASERAEHRATVRSLEIKVQERGRTLSELTDRYIRLQEQHDFGQAKLGRLEGDLEALLRDFSELKLVIFTNFKGSEANQMMLKLSEMQRRVQELLKRNAEPLPTPAVPAGPLQGDGGSPAPQDKL